MTGLVAIVLLTALLRESLGQEDIDAKFPDDFSIGAATSAYQIEGAWNASDKTENIWDWWTHDKPSIIADGKNGDVACDSYHKYEEDVKIIKDMGLNHYRFSLSWSRLLPTGSSNNISTDGVAYYHNVIDELLRYGITPYVTLHHFDDVKSLVEKTGGWVNASMIEYFEDYARFIFREFGSKVKFWTTFNEVNIYCTYVLNVSESSGYRIRYLCAHNILKAHARAYNIYNKEFRSTQNGKVGVIVSSENYLAKSQGDAKSAQVAFSFETGWIMHPIFSESGDYPEVMKQRIAENSKAEGLPTSRLPEFSAEEINYIKGTADYFGLNTYMTWMVESVPKFDGRWFDDAGIKKTLDPKWPTTDVDIFTIVPESIRDILKYIKNTYNDPAVYILENGCALRAELNDTERVLYLYSYLKEVLKAKREGCNVKAYTVWSLLDNFEWFSGYTKRFGIVQVDFSSPNRTRTQKLSSRWLKAVMRGRKLISPNETIPL